MIYVPLPPSPIETKKEKILCLVLASSQHLSSFKSLAKPRCSLPAGRIDQGARTKNTDSGLCI